MPKSKYDIILSWSDEDQVFVAEVPELAGCMAHGKTQEAALRNAKQAIQLWSDTAREFSDPIPEPKTTSDTNSLWVKEAQRRFKEIQDGIAVCRSAEDVLREAREKLTNKI